MASSNDKRGVDESYQLLRTRKIVILSCFLFVFLNLTEHIAHTQMSFFIQLLSGPPISLGQTFLSCDSDLSGDPDRLGHF